MNTSNKTLLQILVEELPKRGGWPDGALNATQDKDGEVCFSDGAVPEFGLAAWEGGNWCGNEFYTITAIDYATAIITRDQYEAALAASKELRPYQVSTEHYTSHASAGKTASADDTDGWIQWAGGECPVERGTLVDIKDRDGFVHLGVEALDNNNADDVFWQRGVCGVSDNEIIAYRLNQTQDTNTRANDDILEAGLNDCIGQAQSNDHARDEILYELANFAATTKTSLDIGVATEIAIWLSGKGYRKQ
ncbi:hypothetical protein G5Z15_003788 [Escherichia coli]|nr:hypothetical protein [Escherichia coli]